ncbi:MAG: ATP synthase subunit I [Rhodomicrobium sp.]
MTGAPNFALAELLTAMAFAGLVSGLLYFLALRRTAILFARGRGWLAPIALTLGRIAAAALLLALAAKLGAAPLLAAFAGFLLARAVALHVAGRLG